MAKDHDLEVSSRRLSRTLLRKPRYERWQHTKAVANQAVKVAVTVPESDQKVLVAAAWLHDIGYTRKLKKTGFHPLDGAIYLRDSGWDPRIVALVAHHSGARFVPVQRGFAGLMAEFPFEDSPVSDALTYADQTRGPYGQPMTVAYRINEAITRHGPDSPNALARVDRVPYLLAVADRVEHRLTQAQKA